MLDILFVMAAEPEYGPELRRLTKAAIVGVGPIEAAIGVTLELQRRMELNRKPGLVVSLGSAGSGRCEVGSVWQISSVCWHDMDATRMGFEKGKTPFTDHPVHIALPTPLTGIPTASLSTGAQVLGGEHFKELEADLADMETFAVVRACQRFGVPVIGLRAVSDGPGKLKGLSDWTEVLGELDRRLAEVVTRLLAAEASLRAAVADVR
jgi:adenosylhomocysteine nucleosidase